MCNTDIKKQQQEGAVTDSDYADRNRLKHIEASLRTKYKHKIFNKFVQAICDFDLVRPNDKIAVCISGGKDSMLMAKLFQELKRRIPAICAPKCAGVSCTGTHRRRAAIKSRWAITSTISSKQVS